MLNIVARTATDKLKIKRVMSRLFQAFVYSVLPEKEHAGYKHASGKVFKSTAFRIRYYDSRFEIEFTALNKEYEKQLAMDILQNGLKLGAVHFADTTISIVDRNTEKTRLHVSGYVVAAIKNPVTGKKVYLQPGEEKHNDIIRNHSLQKYETLFGKPYVGEFEINVTWQGDREKKFYYESGPVTVWPARYEIRAKSEMLNLLMDTSLGAESMKGIGFLEVVT